MRVTVDACGAGYLVAISGIAYDVDAAEAAGHRILAAARLARARAAEEAAAPLPDRIVLYLARADRASARTIAASLGEDVDTVKFTVCDLLAAGRIVAESGFDVPVYRVARAAREEK